MKAILVAQDFAPSQALEMLTRKLIDNGHEVWAFLAHGKSMSGDQGIQTQINDSDVVITGISSSPELSAVEREAIQLAISADVPFCCYADSFGALNRPWFQELLPMAARLFVINESEAEAAAELFTSSQKPEIVVSGNPAWEKFAFPELTRERVRELLGIGSSELVIMSPGIKDLVLNILLWGTIIEAASGTDVLGMLRHDVRVICSLHPGDPNDPQLYQSLTNGDREGLQIEIIPASKMKGSEMLPGIDLVIESFSTIGIEAAHQRIPVIACLTRLARHRYYQQSQRHDWPPYEMGAARVFKNDGSTDLASIISNMLWSSADLRSDMVQNLQDRQAKAYPQPAALGSAVSIMADSIERIKR